MLTKLKNQIKSIIKSPGKVIYFVIVLALIGVTLMGGTSAEKNPNREIRDINELFAIITVFYSFMFVMTSYRGFSNGASMFSMADVNLIFTAPFKQQKVLFYGLFQQLWTSLLMGLFLLFQYTWLHGTYNTTYGDMLIMMVGYGLTVFFAQITAMVIYAFTSADDKRKKIIKAAYFTVIGAFLLYIAAYCLGDTTQLLQRAVVVMNGSVVKLFPVSAWFGRAVSGILLGSSADILLGLSLAVSYLILLVCLVTFGKQDFYEDVLKSSEITQSAITAQKEGRIGDAAPKNVKVGKIGIGKGCGANTIYYKHKIENRRARV
ncbi:MAG: hypothetical protein GX847_08550, partial [Clostridiales bacterium]|nr:hypothetical protein [Clostridiales bacterium]